MPPSQVAIFKDKHTYWMTYLYIMTFGSFIGFSSAFPKLIIDLFDEYGADDCAALQADGTLQAGDCSFTGWPVKGFSPAFLGALIGGQTFTSLPCLCLVTASSSRLPLCPSPSPPTPQARSFGRLAA